MGGKTSFEVVLTWTCEGLATLKCVCVCVCVCAWGGGGGVSSLCHGGGEGGGATSNDWPLKDTL